MIIERLLNILYIMLNKDRVTINELADKLEVSRRTIIRDLERLNIAGIPIISYPGVGGGVGIMEGFKIDKSLFLDNDITTILTGLNSLKSLGDDRKIEYLIQRIIPTGRADSAKESDIIIDLSSWFPKSETHDIISDFRKAIAVYKIIELEYHSHTNYSKRMVEPYKLIFKYSDWYLFAYCTMKDDFRMFKLNRISSYSVLEKGFIPRALDKSSLDFILPLQHKEPESSDKLIDIILEYSLQNKEFLIDKLGAQHFIDYHSFGRIEFQTGDMLWAADLVISLQDKIKVIKPNELRQEVVSRIQKMKSLYK